MSRKPPTAELAPAVVEPAAAPGAGDLPPGLTAGELPPKAFRLPAGPASTRRPGDRPPASAWLVDRYSCRPGIFAALVGGPSRPDWPELRKTALLWGLDQYPREPDPEALPMAPDLRAGSGGGRPAGGGPGGCGAAPRTRGRPGEGRRRQGEAVPPGNQQDPGHPGASTLLDNINLARLPALFHTAPFTPEMIVYAGGGHLLAIVPAGEGPGLARQIERLYERVTVSAQCAAASLHVPRGGCTACGRVLMISR